MDTVRISPPTVHKLRHSSLLRQTENLLCKIEGFHSGTIKDAFFWDMAQCKSCVNRRLGGTYRLHLQRRKVSWEPACISTR
jgi:hypothetical protein